MNPRPSCQPRIVSARGGAEAELAVGPLERDGIDQQVRADPVADDAPSGSGSCRWCRRTSSVGPPRSSPTTGKTSRTWKAWTGWAPSGALVASQRQADARTRGRNRVLDRAAERRDRDAVEQVAAEPVRLDDAGVERVGDAVRAGDQLEVRARRPRTRPRARGSAAGRRPRRPRRAARRRHPDRSSRAGSVRRRSGRSGSGPGTSAAIIGIRPRRRPARRRASAGRGRRATTTATRHDAPGRRRRSAPAACRWRAPARAAVIGAPMTRTLATTVAVGPAQGGQPGRRRRRPAARPVPSAQAHCVAVSPATTGSRPVTAR